MKRQISRPAFALLEQAGVAPGEVDQAVDDLVRARVNAILRANHPIVQKVRSATSINLVQITRRSRHLLIEIEQRSDEKPAWQYRELAPRHCTFSCPGEVPASIQIALNGELLEKLVIPAAAIQGLRIHDVGETGDGWISVAVTPSWNVF